MKIGKTSMSASFPRNLILATEVGYHAISGIHAVDIDSWITFKAYLGQLNKPNIRAKFDTVTIDTVSLLWDLCEKYICSQNDVKELGDIPWGKGYSLCRREFSDSLRRITLMGYGIVCIAHSESRVETADNGDEEIEFVAPALSKRPYAIINQLVDIIGYIGIDKTGNRVIYTRATPTIMAGSRYQYLKEIIPFGYEALSNALADAVEESAKHGAVVVDERIDRFVDTAPTRSFEETMSEAREVFVSLAERGDDAVMDQVSALIAEYFGSEDVKLSDAKPAQQELVEAVIAGMKAL